LPLPSLRPFAVDECLREVLELNPLPTDVVVGLDCPPDLPRVLADVDQLRIVFANLVRNAREAMPGGGRLSLKANLADGGVEVTVTDTGVGIPPDRLARVTEPLYSTKARGLGLGLAIVRAILEKNEGSLRVASAPGQGSKFTVRLLAAPQ
jgi:two-component system NtrC family sensor kinase